MKTKLLIVGAGGFGRVTLEHASRQFDCAFVDDGQAVGTAYSDHWQQQAARGALPQGQSTWLQLSQHYLQQCLHQSACPNRLWLRAFKQRRSTKWRARW